MQSIAYVYAPRQNEQQHESRLSLTRLSVVLSNLALWAALISGVALVLR
jgi:hypothetical protein